MFMRSRLMDKAGKTLALLRLQPFDTSTAAGRAQERHRHIAWTGVTAGTAKATTVAAMLISVPLTLGYLGPERFGMWMAVSAIIAMLGFADLGLSNGVLNAVARASGRDNNTEIRRIIANGFFMLCGIAVLILLGFAATYAHVPWSTLLNVSTATAAAEAGPVVLVLVLCFIANLPLGATQKIQMGLQQGYWANLWETLGSIAGLVGILVAIRLEAGLQWIALAMAGTPVVFRAMNTLVFFGHQHPALIPGTRHIDPAIISGLIRTGILFFILQTATIVGFHSDNVIIARILGVEAVAVYDVAFRLSVIPAMLTGLVVVAQWPAYGEAQARGDTAWIRQTFYRTLRLSLAITIPYAAILALWGDVIIRAWAGPEVIPSRALLAGMAAWSVMLVTGGVISALLNGLHVVRFQAVCASLMACGNILLSIFLVGKIGVSGAIYGTLAAYTVFTLIPCWYFVPRHLERLPAGLTGPGTS